MCRATMAAKERTQPLWIAEVDILYAKVCYAWVGPESKYAHFVHGDTMAL